MSAFDRINCPSDKAWLQERARGIGGSDASAILGLNPWMTSVQLWEQKTGLTEADDAISNLEAVKYGKAAEAPLRTLFRLDFPEYKLSYRRNQLLRNKKLPWLQASLDGELADADGRKGVLEIKTTSILQSMQRERWYDQIPQNYFVQVLHYLLVTGYDFAIVKAQLKTVWAGDVRVTVKHYHFERQELIDDLKHLLSREIVFWDHVQSNTRPPLELPPI